MSDARPTLRPTSGKPLTTRMLSAGTPLSTNIEDRRGQDLTPDERKAAIAASYIDSALLGYGDIPLAAAMSLIPGRGSYRDELNQARYLETGLQAHEPEANAIVRTAGLLSPGGVVKGARRAYQAIGESAGPIAAMGGLLGIPLVGGPTIGAENWRDVASPSWGGGQAVAPPQSHEVDTLIKRPRSTQRLVSKAPQFDPTFDIATLLAGN